MDVSMMWICSKDEKNGGVLAKKLKNAYFRPSKM